MLLLLLLILVVSSVLGRLGGERLVNLLLLVQMLVNLLHSRLLMRGTAHLGRHCLVLEDGWQHLLDTLLNVHLLLGN